MQRAAIAAASGFRPDRPAKGSAPVRCLPDGRTVERLRKRPQFLAVRRGDKRRGRYFLLEVLDRDDGQAPRFGITVTKKAGNAVERNRIRRRVREACRTGAAAEMSRGHDYVIVGRRQILDVPFGMLKDELSRRIRGKG